MNIGIDGYEANTKELVGVGTWGYELIHHLYDIDTKNSYVIFLPTAPNNHLPKERENWRYRIIPSYGLWTISFLPFGIWTNREKIDVFFSPTHYIPRFVDIPRVVSIMDLSYIHYPEMFRTKDLFQLKNWTAYSVKHAKKIITISEFTKSEIIKYYQVPKEKIIVAYPGCNIIQDQISNSKNQKYILNIKKKYHIDGEYLLFVGTLQPRKNIVRLIEAFNRAIKQCNNLTMKLVIVGKKGWLYHEIFQKVKNLKLEDRVRFSGFVSDNDMPYLYAGARCFVLPSLYEGFGLPVIEAMVCGTPIVISNNSSLPEVGGEAAIYIDPQNTESIKEGIMRALQLNNKKKNELIKKARGQISKFSWQKCAEIVLKTLKDIK